MSFLFQEISDYPLLKKYGDLFSKLVFAVVFITTAFFPSSFLIDHQFQIALILMLLILMVAILGMESPIRQGVKPSQRQLSSVTRIIGVVIMIVAVVSIFATQELFFGFILASAMLMRLSNTIAKGRDNAVVWMVLSFCYVFFISFDSKNNFSQFQYVLRVIYYFLIGFVI
jgi:hypothetical protein